MKNFIARSITLAFIFATSTAAASARDVCDIVTTSDVNAVFAPRVFVIKNSGPFAGKPYTSKYAQLSDCKFVSKGAAVKDRLTVSVSLRLASSDKYGVTVKEMKEGVVKLGGAPVDVPGIGDSAYWVSEILGSKLGARHLVVFKGKRIMLTISDYAPKRSEAETITDLKKIAGAALAKL